ncbi:MAG TPA: hypothetical protein G4O11_05455 [Anaerolineae bacterium]|nr:hypothetical protein [Anaerolineae bacterium]
MNCPYTVLIEGPVYMERNGGIAGIHGMDGELPLRCSDLGFHHPDSHPEPVEG